MYNITVMLFLVFTITLNAQFAGGSGTEADPYQITNVTELQNMNLYLDAHYIIMNDIDASETRTWNAGAGFVPVGGYYYQTSFKGYLDGQNFTISDLYINVPTDTDPVGLFRSSYDPLLTYSNLKNIILENIDYHVGGFAGALTGINNRSISNCHSSGTIIATITGVNPMGGDIGLGGLVGVNNWDMMNCSSSCDVTGINTVGGLIGTNNSPDAEDFGMMKCYSTGNVSGEYEVGGFAGKIIGGNVYNCYSTGDVYNSSGKSGGFVGYVGSSYYIDIYRCYSNGYVYGNTDTGGFSGSQINYNVNIFSSYWDTETSHQSTSTGGTGKTTAEMQTQSTYSEWDFAGESYYGDEDIWSINPLLNGGYPYLTGQFPQTPQNVTTAVNGTNMIISWDPAADAISYKVYASFEPFTGFSDLSDFGTFNGTTWSSPFFGDKMFYYVISSTENSKSKPIENVTKEMILEYLRK